MIYEPSVIAVFVFFVFVGITLGLSFYLGRRAKSSQGYFAAHGQIHWAVNGIAFAGDYLSAASFLGICGMIAFYGYDGFLYSIGYLAGWIVALFVIAEPMKRLGKFTFADALNANYGSRGIKLVAGISTLVVSIFYLIPQMVGAGVLIQPLLGFPHWLGVVIVGAVVITIVVTAGMVSTTYVQFLKGSLLIVFSLVLTVLILGRGFGTKELPWDNQQVGNLTFPLQLDLQPEAAQQWAAFQAAMQWQKIESGGVEFSRATDPQTGRQYYFRILGSGYGDRSNTVELTQWVTRTPDGLVSVNGLPLGMDEGQAVLSPVGRVHDVGDSRESTGPLGPISFFDEFSRTQVELWRKVVHREPDGSVTDIYFREIKPGSQVLTPGEHPRFKGIRSENPLDKLNFLSLMLALFCGTASLPHILIRYYTVPSEIAARKSTIVGIGTIGFFYILTLYMGIGAMTSGALDVTDSNMAAPLLARSFGEWLFAIISAIAFTTVLGTVSGLIIASSGAVAHDLVQSFAKDELGDFYQVRLAKIASIVVGVIAIVLGILFKELNVSYLVGWAFSVAASANLPSLVMLLFWKGTTRTGIIVAVTVGMVSSLAWILLSADTFTKVYGLPADSALVPFSQPGIVTIPLGFLTLIVVSLFTQKRPDEA